MGRSIEEILTLVRIEEIELEPAARVDPETRLEEVYRLLDEGRRGAVLVCRGERLAGIFTDRDVLYRTALGELPGETPVGEAMTPDPVTLSPRQRLAEAIRLMNRHGHRHVPLVNAAGRCTGEVASRDILRFVAGHFPEVVLNLPPRLHQRLTRPEGG